MPKRLMVAVAAGCLLIFLPACGKKTDEATRAAGITPNDAIFFITVNLDPSIEQKRNLLSIAKKFPAASDKVKGEFDETRDELLTDLVKEVDLDFAKDVKPWLGNEVAFAALPQEGKEPLATVFVQTTDEDKARTALVKAAKSGEFEGEYRVVDGFVVITDHEEKADNAKLFDLVEAQSKKDDGGLAKADQFTEVVDELAGDRLVLMWADVQAALKVADDLAAIPGFDLTKAFEKAGPVALDVHAEKEAVVFEGVSRPFIETKGGTAAITESLPANSLGTFTFFDVGTAFKEISRLIGGSGEDLTSGFKDATGIDLEADILSWMEGEFVLVAGAVPEGQDFPDFALVVEPTDQDKAKAAIPKILDAIKNTGEITLEERKLAGTTAYVVPEPFTDGIQPAMALFEKRFVLANRPEYLEELSKAASPALGDSKAYKAIVGEGSSKTVGQMVLQLDPIREAIEDIFLGEADDEDRADYEREFKPNVEPLESYGFLARHDGKFDRFEMKITFD